MKAAQTAHVPVSFPFWQGYKGRFGLFNWPTEAGVSGTLDALLDRQKDDRSEQKAYLSATALRKLLASLNQLYPGNVDVVAHSMGNVVVSEALRQEAYSTDRNKKIVHNYVASQAAMAANAYYASAPYRSNQPYGGFGSILDLYSIYPVNGKPYFADINLATDNKPINFFNPDDYALGRWETDENFKPDQGYAYVATLGFYKISTDLISPNRYYTIPNDTYPVFAFADPTRSKALGAQPDVAGPFDVNHQVDLTDAAYAFTNAQNEHSAQFNRTIMGSWAYWQTLLHASFGL